MVEASAKGTGEQEKAVWHILFGQLEPQLGIGEILGRREAMDGDAQFFRPLP